MFSSGTVSVPWLTTEFRLQYLGKRNSLTCRFVWSSPSLTTRTHFSAFVCVFVDTLHVWFLYLQLQSRSLYSLPFSSLFCITSSNNIIPTPIQTHNKVEKYAFTKEKIYVLFCMSIKLRPSHQDNINWRCLKKDAGYFYVRLGIWRKWIIGTIIAFIISIGLWRWLINIIIRVLDIIYPVFHLKHNVSETGFRSGDWLPLSNWPN
jgi:hypothetical protein